MSESGVKPFPDFVLPQNLVSKLDVAHLVRDAERVDNQLTEAEARAKSGVQGEQQSPSYSEQLTTFLQQNELSFDNSHIRSEIIKELRQLKDKVPAIHMTFSSEADRESLESVTKWLRDSVHPQAVIDDGVQPSLVAGVYVRTPNHVHDLSLRSKLKASRDLLAKELEAIRGNQ